jgi:predicted ATPase
LSPKKIVIAGGPSTGKTSVVSGIEAAGFLCFHEISRAITLQAREEGIEQLFLTDPLLFSQRILEGRLAQYHDAEKLDNAVVFFDRGLPDVVAYLDCFGTPYPEEFTTICAANVYDEIFLLPPWEEIHTSDNERYENFEEALRIHDCLEHAYTSFGYAVIDVPKVSVKERVQFIIEKLKIS